MGSNLQNNDKNRKDIFIMKSTDGAAFALKKWLEDRKFNNFSFGWKDKRGNDGIGLNEEYGDLKNPKITKAGVIICLDGSFDKAREIVENHLGYGEEDETQPVYNY